MTASACRFLPAYPAGARGSRAAQQASPVLQQALHPACPAGAALQLRLQRAHQPAPARGGRFSAFHHSPLTYPPALLSMRSRRPQRATAAATRPSISPSCRTSQACAACKHERSHPGGDTSRQAAPRRHNNQNSRSSPRSPPAELRCHSAPRLPSGPCPAGRLRVHMEGRVKRAAAGPAEQTSGAGAWRPAARSRSAHRP